ncbi:MAG: TAXI family TRAP transporter solute-binding subunit [Chloroflexi bacterium]|nr:TAXI family TRAP transporter solute-binding subunit [Chloroflexota bacterium]
MAIASFLRRRPALLFLFAIVLFSSSCVDVAGSAGPSQTAGPIYAVGGTPTPATAPWPTPTRAVPRELRLAAGSPGSAYDSFAQAIAVVWMARLPGLKVIVLPTGGPADNIRLLDSGGADVALTRDDLSIEAANKTPPFNQPYPIRVAALAALYEESVQIIAGADTNIVDSHGLSNKKVSMPPGDSAASVTLWQVLGAGKFQPSDFADILVLPDDQAAAAFRDKRVDVLMTTVAGPVSGLQQAAQQRPVRVVPIVPGWQQQARDRYPFLFGSVIPAGTYNGQDGPASTLGVRGILVARRDMPNDYAYELVKALVEGKDDLAARSPVGKLFDPKQVTQRISTPFHVGAVDYYREAGLSK